MEVMAYSLMNYTPAKAKKLEEALDHLKQNTRITTKKTRYADNKKYKWVEFCIENGIPFKDNSCPACFFRISKDEKWQLLGTGQSSIEKLYKLGESYTK